jgi:archaeal flagellin FlaB
MRANRAARAAADDTAEVGIGTLIVFIATILVAAVAAATLISTSNRLQEKAQSTGAEATQQVATNLGIVRVAGVNDGAGGDVEDLIVMVTLAPGAKQYDLGQTLIRITDGTIDARLFYVDGAATATEFSAASVRDEDNSFTGAQPVMTPGDLIELTIDLDLMGMPLPPRTSIEMDIIPEVGLPVSSEFRTPATYGNDALFTLG